MRLRIFVPVAAAVGVAAALVAGCGDDAPSATDAPAAPTATAAGVPATATAAAPPAGATALGAGSGEGGVTAGTPLSSGVYYTETFAPRVVFTLGEGWGNAGQEPTQLLLLRKPEPGDIALTIDSAGTRDVAATVDALTSVRGTEASAVVDTVVAGFPAGRFEITVVEQIQGPVRIPTLADIYSTFEGDRLCVWVFDANGVTVKVIAEAQGPDFDAFVALVEELVGSLRVE